jgi:predicted nucleic acid-binding protein
MIDVNTLKTSVQGKKVLIDTNIIIYLSEEIAPYNQLSRELFSLIEEGEGSGVISILSVFEVMQGPIRAGNTNIAMAVKNYLMNFPNTHCPQVSPELLEVVGQDNRVKWKTLRTVDALIIASGLYAEVDLFISNDRHFFNSLPPGLMLSFGG